MITPLVQPLFRWLRLSLTPPTPIAGARVQQVLQPGLRAYQLRLLKWAAAQLSALAGVVLLLTAFDFTQWLPPWLSVLEYIEYFAWWDDFTDFLPVEWRWLGAALTMSGFLVQLPLSFLSLWAERRTTWYVISDQGVQLQHGLWTTHETSLRFANIQQVTLRQGPLQRLLGLADVVVSTAGGARPADEDDEDTKRQDQGRLRDLDYAEARRLGDTLRDQLHAPRAPALPAPLPSLPALEAAQRLLTETRALRNSLAQPASRPEPAPPASEELQRELD